MPDTPIPFTRGQIAADDVKALLRSRAPLLWIVSKEEGRAESLLFEAVKAAKYNPHTWDVAQGACNPDGKLMESVSAKDPGEMLAAIKLRAEQAFPSRDAWILRDLPLWLDGLPGATTLRQLRNLARYLPRVQNDRAQAIIILTTDTKVPADLTDHATVIEWPLPDRAEIAAVLDSSIAGLPAGLRESAAPNGRREAAIDAAVGLTEEEARGCYARSLVQFRTIDPAAVANEKKRVIARERVLEWIDPLPGGLSSVGGLENLKAWLRSRMSAYSPAAKAYGLPAPKGCLIGGIPGTGKSLCAKAYSYELEAPLLRFDPGSLKSKWVGESEQTLRRALRTIEAVGRCVVWIDEIEKALAGATQGAADGGVSSDALGAILNWMQERTSEAFIIATANDVESLPPELLRKGRFDEVWWVDLPSFAEREAILAAALKTHKRDLPALKDYAAVAAVTEQFTGSEIAALVPEAMFKAFGDAGREITTDDLVSVAEGITPLAKTSPAKINRLRDWAKGKARLASATVAAGSDDTVRRLDF